MRSIGEMARASGLGVSALRFYDRAGVLVPARVDPVSGYRWYAPEQLAEARVLARLRRAGMPLADVRLVLAGWSNAKTALVRRLLDGHLRRLERGLADARREFSALRAHLDHREDPMTPLPTPTVRLTVRAQELASALDAVRFAASTDPELPMLGGLLFDVEGDRLRVVATDRYRLAVTGIGVTGHGGDRVQALVPAPLADAMRALLDGGGTVELAVDGGHVTLRAADRQAAGRCLDHDFPDYRRLVSLPEGRRATVDAPAFRTRLESGWVRRGATREQDLSVLGVADGGALALLEDGADGPGRVVVNRRFLMDALAAGGRDRLVLELGAPTAPLAIRRPDDADTFSLLMPVRVED